MMIDLGLSQLFRNQAERTPEAIALRTRGRWMTYAELNDRSDRAAGYFQRVGVGRGAVVGLALARSADLIICILGSLKAGAAYLPLDPNYPSERLRYMLSDADVKIVVTQTPRNKAWFGCRAVGPDVVIQSPISTRFSDTSPSDIAYIMYTSGSTGEPKGVLVTHSNVAHLALAKDIRTVLPTDRFIHYSSPSFDASTYEIWSPLLNGASLTLYEENQIDLKDLSQLIRDERVNVLWMTAGLFHQAVEMRAPCISEVETLIAGGDALSPKHVIAALSLRRGQPVINGYGPTECTTFSTCAVLTPGSDYGGGAPIGRPLSHVITYVLDEKLRPCPKGVTGELYIGGAGVAAGYLNKPAVTAERFLPNPFQAGTIYRTGDIVHADLDGTIFFHGRADAQVKVRGYRIEIPEIEAAIAKCTGVASCAVVVTQNKWEDKQLTAYVTTDDRTAAQETVNTVRLELRRQLPDYMVPSSIQVLQQLPLTPNGKVDRDQLQRGEQNLTYPSPDLCGPTQVDGLWLEVLGLARADRSASFIDLGGNSLLAIRLSALIEDRLGKTVSPKSIYALESLDNLSKHLQNLPLKTSRLQPESSQLCVESPLTFSQERLWFLDQYLGTGHTYNVLWPLRLEGKLHVESITHAVNSLRARHSSLRTRFGESNGEPHQIIENPAPMEIPLISLAAVPLAERQASLISLAETETFVPFDILSTPPWRALLVEVEPDLHYLLLILHHIICDGRSMAVATNELGLLYGAHLSGTHPTLPPIGRQPIEHALREKEADPVDAARSIAYWKEQLSNAPAQIGTLPLDVELGGRPSAALSVNVPSELTKQLRATARDQKVSLFTVLLSAYQITLGVLGNTHELIVGTAVENRVDPALRSTFGMFVNTLPLRAKLDPTLSLRDFIRANWANVLDAYEHQSTPFQHIVTAVRPDRRANRQPLVQASFVMHPAETNGFSAQGLTATLDESLVPPAAKIQMLLELREVETGLSGRLIIPEPNDPTGTAHAVAKTFLEILALASNDPDLTLWDLGLSAGANLETT
jgi:amino acid adenylation domain-containing protein